jgi:tetratricopeptide (TPR) repeat protein
MNEMTRRALAGAALIFSMPLFIAPAAAQFHAEVSWCANKGNNISPDLQIQGCTAVITAGRVGGKELAWAYDKRGTGYKRSNDLDRALADYNQAIAVDPAYAMAFYNRGSLYDGKDDHARAIADYDAAIRADANYADAYNGRCLARAEVGSDLALALSDCNQALKLRPGDAYILDSRGFVYLRLGRFDDAIADYDTALKTNPKIATSLYGRGVAKQKKGDSAGGTVDMAAANLLDPSIAGEFASYGVK